MTTMTFDENHVFTEPSEPAVTTPKPKKTQANTKRKDNTTTNDLPLSPGDMTSYLISQHGKPCVLREEGIDNILCPHCGELHYHPDAHGHYRASCADDYSGAHITIGSRSFNPAHGYDIYEHKKIVEGSNTHYQIRPLN